MQSPSMLSRKSPRLFIRTSIPLTACVLTIALCVPLISVKAQTPTPHEKRAAIQELITLIGATHAAKAMFVTLIDRYSQALAKDSIEKFEGQNWPPPYKEKMLSLARDFYDRLSLRLREEVPQRLQYEEKANRLYIDAYDEYFTESEVRDLISFYRSPVGLKFLGLGPKVGPGLQKKFEAEMGSEVLTVTRAIVAEEVKQLEERASHELKASPGTKKE